MKAHNPMNAPGSSPCNYPNKMGRIILLALEEIIERSGVNAVLNQARLDELINDYPPANLDLQFECTALAAIMTALESIYGPRGGRGVALRTGRACLKYGLREFGSLLGLTELTFRLLPLDEKIRFGAEAVAQFFSKVSHQRINLMEDEEHFIWNLENCPLCWGRHTHSPTCHLTVGLLQEALYWVSGGKFFEVEETECCGCGDPACKIVIAKQPFE
jgi:predicted hydrocarbon binding protein